MTTTIELERAGTFEPIAYSDFEIENGTSDVRIAPEATITTANSVPVDSNQRVRIVIDGVTRFSGRTTSEGTRRRNGQRRVRAEHEAYRVFDEAVSVGPTSDAETVLQDAIAATSFAAGLSVTYTGTSETLTEAYDVDNRKVKSIFRDIVDRTNRVWWVAADGTITVQPRGGRGEWTSVSLPGDDAAIDSYEAGDVRSVLNDVTVVGTGEERVEGTATDSTSISEYGRRSETFNLQYVTTASEADAAAAELLQPTPLDSASVIVGGSVGTNPDQNLSNYEISLFDDSFDLSGDMFTIESQSIEQGRVTLDVGEAATNGIDSVNRASKSAGDVTNLGNAIGAGDIGDNTIGTEQLVDESVIAAKLADAGVTSEKLVDEAVIEQKLADAGVTSGKLVDGAVIEQKLADAGVTNNKLADLSVDETKIQDSSISTPKLRAEAVTASEIAADTITAAEIAANTISALEIEGETITANEIASRTIIADNIAGGTITGIKIKAGAITSNEIDSQTIVASNIAAGAIDTLRIAAGAVTANEIEANTITADQIDTLELDATEVTIGTPPVTSIEFDVEATASGAVTNMIPGSSLNPGSVGTASRPFLSMNAGAFNTQSPEELTGVAPEDIVDYDWYNPPEYVCQREAAKDDDREYVRQNPKKSGVELGHMTNYLLETCKAQQERIDDLESRLADLESQVGPNA